MEDKYVYYTIEKPVEAMFKDRGSKFLAYAYPVTSEKKIKEYIQQLKKEHPKAVHHCVAWRLGYDGNLFRANDDGEPSGTAGKPMLGQIDSMMLTNVLVVVVRYFGGTLLGVPGLIHAYKTVTADALQQATIIEKWIENYYQLRFEYPVMDEVLRILRQAEVQIYKQEMQLWCEFQVGIPIKYMTTCMEKLKDVKGLTIESLQMPDA